MAGTVVSLLASGHIQQGMPQIRKFYVFFILLVVYSTFRELAEIRAIALLWAADRDALGRAQLLPVLAHVPAVARAAAEAFTTSTWDRASPAS